MDNNQFEIYIDYDKDSDNPERVFLSLAKLVSEFSNFDNIVCETLPVKVNHRIILDKVEDGSIKAFFKQAIELIEDEPLKNLDLKGIIGHALVKGKHKLLETLKEDPSKPTVDVKQLQTDIFELSKDIKTNQLQTITPIPPIKLAKCLEGVNTAFGHLTSKDRFKYISKDTTTETHFNKTFSMAYEKTQLIEQNMTKNYKALLVVKKPDLLSDSSQWEFKYNDTCIKARIEDTDWLSKFQNREFSIQAKDSIECDLQIQTKDITGVKTEVIYTVTKVYKVVPYNKPKQLNIDDKYPKPQ